jgi:flagellar biosynthesis protein FlhB
MFGGKEETSPILSIIIFATLAFVLALLSTFVTIMLLACFSAIIVVGIGVCTEIMIKLRKWEWASTTEYFKDGSSLTSMKMTIAGTWVVGPLLCPFLSS